MLRSKHSIGLAFTDSLALCIYCICMTMEMTDIYSSIKCLWAWCFFLA